MEQKTKILFFITFIFAMLFGFTHLVFPSYNFERLHIFLFNLCGGGSIIIYFTENHNKMTTKDIAFFIISFFYAIFSFLHLYPFAIISSLILFTIVESVRIKKFSFFPHDIFSSSNPISKKFHHAALICLSLGLLLSTFAIINHEYLKILPFKKFTLNTFFLGFSFPVSLITLSVIFETLEKSDTYTRSRITNLIFWSINIGVIVFFAFILFESLFLELVISFILFFAVLLVFLLYTYSAKKEQQKTFLSSGILFLVLTAFTGVLYITMLFYPERFQTNSLQFVKNIHRIISLYGWNLSGLIVIIRRYDFPINFHSKKIILLHWVTVLLFAPLGYYYKTFALAALILYTVFLYYVFFSKCENQECSALIK